MEANVEQMLTERGILCTPLTKRAAEIMIRQHGGQKDKAKRPYFLHPLWVAEHTEGHDKDEDTVIAALLHDVLEDTGYTRRQLQADGFSEATLHALDLLTHVIPPGLKPQDKESEYLSYVDIIRDDNGIAKRVKLADLRNNSDVSRLPPADRDTPETHARLAKYQKAIQELTGK